MAAQGNLIPSIENERQARITRACALKGGDWLLSKVGARRLVNDLEMADLEGMAVEVIGEFVRQLALEGRTAETEAVPERSFTD